MGKIIRCIFQSTSWALDTNRYTSMVEYNAPIWYDVLYRLQDVNCTFGRIRMKLCRCTLRMTDALTIDLFIQDFVNTNKLLNQRVMWDSLVNRRFAETGATRVLSFESDGHVHHAVARFVILPESDWLRVELTHAIPSIDDGGHRFDCLRMLSARTHTDLQVEREGTSTIIVRLTTKHRGLVNIVFVVRDGLALSNPFLV